MASNFRFYYVPLYALFATLPLIWSRKVNEIVPEPYLDEVFHVGQAQAYCAGNFREWDPKITTPPGLYVCSYLAFLLTGKCDVPTLRAINSLALLLTSVAAYSILRILPPSRQPLKAQAGNVEKVVSQHEWFDIHTALNIALFPPLFFFSGLYYTDIFSTLSVLVSYRLCHENQDSKHQSISVTLLILLNGVFAMLCRQTNVFWAAVFPGALTVIFRLSPSTLQNDVNACRKTSFRYIVNESWRKGKFYDCSVTNASAEDYLKVALSIILNIARQPIYVLSSVWPYLSLVFLFAMFVAANGGVVLGDKSNHVATIHLTQMLYFWPYILFFSFPLAIPWILSLAQDIISKISKRDEKDGDGTFLLYRIFPRLPIVAISIIASSVIVRYNTIVHPFTLADNRHYVFYTFRLLRRHPAIIYAVIPIYLACAWMAINILDKPRLTNNEMSSTKSNRRKNTKEELDSKSTDGRVSFVLTWVGVTALSVVTAPLVEPRYFIIPWIIWRLNIPRTGPHYKSMQKPRREGKGQPPEPGTPGLFAFYFDQGVALWLETLWFVFVNFLTGYVFIHRGFAWPQEPGKTQRFMW